MSLSPINSLQPKASAYAAGLAVKSGATQPRFSGVFGQEALQGLAVDTLGILGPKLVVARGNMNRTEEWVLEGLEDVAFYFAVPLAGNYVFGKAFSALLKRQGLDAGKQFLSGALEKAPKALAHNRFLAGAKTGTLLSTVALAAGIEYLVPHVKNWITAKAYKTKNFGAVAALEESRTQLEEGETDPVDKAKRRILPVAAAVAGAVAVGFALPFLASRVGGVAAASRFVGKHFNFGQGSAFDMSKPILAVLALVGLAGYIDGARNDIERKELLTRVGVFTIPYYLFGKELVGNALGHWQQNTKIDVNGVMTPIKNLVPFIDKNLPKTSFLDFNRVVSDTHVVDVLKRKAVSSEVISKVVGKLNFIWYSKFVLSALVVGVLSNLLAYHQTRQRYAAKKEEAAALALKTQRSSARTAFSATERRQPLSDQRLSASTATTVVAPAPQPAFQLLPYSAGPYTGSYNPWSQWNEAQYGVAANAGWGAYGQ